jgi:Bacterial shufflon protein, N-terminal constant region
VTGIFPQDVSTPGNIEGVVARINDLDRRLRGVETVRTFIQSGALDPSVIDMSGGLSTLSTNLGSITAGSISGTNISGSTITGGTIQTSSNPGVARVIMDGDGLRGYVSAGNLAFDINTSNGTAFFAGIGQLDANSVIPTVTLAGALPGGNLVPNSSFEQGTNAVTLVDSWSEGWQAVAGSIAKHTTAANVLEGLNSVALTCAAGTWDGVARQSTARVKVRGGRPYVLSGYAKAAATARNYYVEVSWYTAAGALISTATSAAFPGSSTAWTRPYLKIPAAPATADSAVVRLLVNSPAAAEIHYIDALQLEEGDVLTNFTPAVNEILYSSLRAQFIGAGEIKANNLSADAIDGKTITGATFRTAATGARLEMTASGIIHYLAGGSQAVALTPSEGLTMIASTADAGDPIPITSGLTWKDPLNTVNIVSQISGQQYYINAGGVVGYFRRTVLEAKQRALGGGENTAGAQVMAQVTLTNGTKHYATLLDHAGNTGFPGAVTAATLEASSNGRIRGEFYVGDTGNGRWVRTYASTGWYNETHQGGVYMTDSTWVRTYNGKYYLAPTIQAEVKLEAGGYAVVGGGSFMHYPGSGASTWLHLRRADNNNSAQDLTVGGLYSYSDLTQIKAPVDDLAGLVETRVEDRLQPGELVAIDTDVEYEDGWEEGYFRVRRARAEDADRVLGVISDRATARLAMGVLRYGHHGTAEIDGRADWRKLIAYSGVIPTKATMENGKIRAGDRLCMGNEAGTSMRATQEGHVIGIALRDLASDGEVIMLVAPGYWAGKPQPKRKDKARTRRKIPVEPLIPEPDVHDDEWYAQRGGMERDTELEKRFEQHRQALIELHDEWAAQQQEAVVDAVLA